MIYIVWRRASWSLRLISAGLAFTWRGGKLRWTMLKGTPLLWTLVMHFELVWIGDIRCDRCWKSPAVREDTEKTDLHNALAIIDWFPDCLKMLLEAVSAEIISLCPFYPACAKMSTNADVSHVLDTAVVHVHTCLILCVRSSRSLFKVLGRSSNIKPLRQDSR